MLTSKILKKHAYDKAKLLVAGRKELVGCALVNPKALQHVITINITMCTHIIIRTTKHCLNSNSCTANATLLLMSVWPDGETRSLTESAQFLQTFLFRVAIKLIDRTLLICASHYVGAQFPSSTSARPHCRPQPFKVSPS